MRTVCEDSGSGSIRLAKLKSSDGEEIVNVKKVRVDAAESSSSQSAIVREATALMCLRGNRWVPEIKFYYRDTLHHYLGTGVLDCEDLESVLERRTALPIHEARDIIAQLVLAIESLHSFGFIHRNLKPETIVFDSRGCLRLTGFDLCHRLGERVDCDNLPVDYFAPETLTDPVPCSSSVDVWSVGVILYELVYGGPPFSDDSRDRNKTIYRIIHSERYLWFPHHDDPDAPVVNDLISLLLKPVGDRIPIKDMKSHAFLRSIDWTDLRLPDSIRSIPDTHSIIFHYKSPAGRLNVCNTSTTLMYT